MVQIEKDQCSVMDSSIEAVATMKTNPKQSRAIHRKKRKRSGQRSLEDEYRKIFLVPVQQSPVRDRLSMYKAVPSITTYGVYDSPV